MTAVPGVQRAYRFITEPPAPDGNPTLGVDFFINWAGSFTWSQGGIPYQNESVAYAAINSGRVPPNYLNRVLNDNFPRRPINPQYMGFVSLPTILWLLKPFSQLPFVPAMLAFWAFSIVAYASCIGLITAKVVGGDKLRRWGAVMMAWSVFLGADTNLRNSLQLGQIDALYLLPVSIAVFLFAFQFQHRSARWGSGVSLGLATMTKGFPGLIVPFMMAAAAIQAYRSVGAQLHDKWIIRGGALLKNPLVESTLAWIITVGALGWYTLFQVDSSIVLAWQRKIAIMADLPQLRLTLTPDLHHFLSYWLNVYGVQPPLASYLLMTAVAIPLAGWAAIAFADAADSQNESVRFLGGGMLIAMFPILNVQHADYYNLIIFIPLLACVSPRLPHWDRNWKGLFVPYAAVLAGYCLINTGIRTALMTRETQQWWFAARELQQAEELSYREGSPVMLVATSDALFGGFPGSLMMVLGFLALLRLARPRIHKPRPAAQLA